jgi:hypothetical protein
VAAITPEGTPLVLLDSAIPGATNDAMLELAYRVLENLADRAESAADFAIDSDNRDVENEALVFITEVNQLVPGLFGAPRLREEASYKVADAKADLGKAIRNRRARLEGKQTALEQFSHRRQRRVRSAWEVESRREAARAAQTVKLANVTQTRVLKALASASENGDARVADVMAALDPRLADTSIAGRQQVVAQVGKILRRLAAEGRVAKVRPDNYDNGRRHPHRYTLTEANDAS